MKYLLCLLWGAAVRYIISKYRERRVIDSYKFEYIHFFLMPIRRAMVCSFWTISIMGKMYPMPSKRFLSHYRRVIFLPLPNRMEPTIPC